MRSFGNFMLIGRLQAVMAISLLTVFALLFPPLSYLLSGVPAGFVILRKGPVYGLQVLLVCLLAVVMFVTLAGMAPQFAFAFALGIWVPIFICCCVLRIMQSQGWLVLASGSIAVAYILVLHWLVDDVAAWWLQWMQILISNAFPDGSGEQYQENLTRAAPAVNAMIASGICINLVVSTFLSRWWQSVLFNPGGFRTEFYALRLPNVIVFLALLGIGFLFLDGGQQGSLGLDIVVIVIVMYLFQGLASVHRIVAAKKMSRTWLVMMYILLLFVPQTVMLIACLGLVDLWMNRTSNLDRNQS